MRRTIPSTDLTVAPWCLGGNVFGWTADEQGSREVLDAYVEAGGNFVDTADLYAQWAEGNVGGESESIIGRWLAGRGRRDDVVLATKVGMHPGRAGLSARTIVRTCEESLRRLRTDHVDLYYAHVDDARTPLDETLAAFDTLVRDGKIRYAGASNIDADRLASALGESRRLGLVAYSALQPHYNLVHRHEYEDALMDLCVTEGIGVMPYYALAEGLLTGKYRPGGPTVDSERSDDAMLLLDERAARVLAVLDEVAEAHHVAPAAVALAWLRDRPGVVAPVASARTAEQVVDLAPSMSLVLTPEEVSDLTDASR